MPYIKKDKREKINEIVKMMQEADIKADGDLNYLLFTHCISSVKPGYNNFKNYIAELNECGREIARRYLASYEDQKIIENGDCFPL